MKLNQLEKKIFEEYKCIFKKYPDWAFQLYPTIPVIGNKMNKMQKRVLSYASAENITNKDYEELRRLPLGEQFCRGRHSQENQKNNNYFKNVHINPFETGLQYIITWFMLKELGLKKFSNQPYNFAEEIAIANISKFTIRRNEAKRNNDPKAWEEFEPSIPYLTKDFKIIKPDIVIIPKTRFDIIKKCNWKKIINEAPLDKKVTFVKIYQAVPQNTNTTGCEGGDIGVSSIEEWFTRCSYGKRLKAHLRLLRRELKDRIEEI